MNKMKRLTGRKILLVAVAFCAFGFAKAQDGEEYPNLNLRQSLGNCIG